MSLASGVASFGLASPLLATINQDIGPSPDIDWVSYVYNLVLACSLCLVGRLGDIFGRRWFFITGNFLALIGTIIAATSVNVPMLIVGMAVTSLGSSTQLSFQYVMGELVPVGKRFIVMSSLFVWTLPLVSISSHNLSVVNLIQNKLRVVLVQSSRQAFKIIRIFTGDGASGYVRYSTSCQRYSICCSIIHLASVEWNLQSRSLKHSESSIELESFFLVVDSSFS